MSGITAMFYGGPRDGEIRKIAHPLAAIEFPVEPDLVGALEGRDVPDPPRTILYRRTVDMVTVARYDYAGQR